MAKGDMSVSQAGKKGGLTVSKKYGKGFYSEIGKKGGRIGGPRGGQATKARHGHDFYEEIGHKGGQKVKDLINKGKRS